MGKLILTILTMIETIKILSKGQIVIPEKIRKNLGLEKGTNLILIERGKRIILEKEDEFLKELDLNEKQKEKFGWLSVAEKSLNKVWDNEKDDEIWGNYL